jgi:fructose/tagatose bisphosphate aldolase
MTNHEHDHNGEEETFGLALGFRIIDQGGEFFLAEAEIAPYVDEPDELGVTLVFHPLSGINPIAIDEEVDWPSWTVDIDDDLKRASGESIEQQFEAIVRQLHQMEAAQLREYLQAAREESEE